MRDPHSFCLCLCHLLLLCIVLVASSVVRSGCWNQSTVRSFRTFTPMMPSSRSARRSHFHFHEAQTESRTIPKSTNSSRFLYLTYMRVSSAFDLPNSIVCVFAECLVSRCPNFSAGKLVPSFVSVCAPDAPSSADGDGRKKAGRRRGNAGGEGYLGTELRAY